jgi:hypothetical protein
MGRLNKLHINKPKRQRKFKKKEDWTSKCDKCGKDLGRHCLRTDGGAICAKGIYGIIIRRREFFPRWKFYCSQECSDTDLPR